MPRQPIDKQKQHLRGQDLYWATIRELAAWYGTFTVRNVMMQSNGGKESVAEYMRRLEAAGYIERYGRSGLSILYRLARDSRFAPRVRRDGTEIGETMQDHMWRTMKMLSRFSAHDLAVAASTDEVAVSGPHAKNYIRLLHRAGYVRVVSKKPMTYMMIPSKNTGPRAPYVQRVQQVFDPNLQKVVWRSDDDDDE